ncbi:tyrosinase family protein [Sphingomonas sp. MMS24-J45]|uniref:tyrosinase family protein n=1 Tax=Sphingomonas sp. MMS24-J45 TaxID=3238806 RepID=UPI00384FE49F
MNHSLLGAFAALLSAIVTFGAAPAQAAERAAVRPHDAHDAAHVAEQRYWQHATANLRSAAASALGGGAAQMPVSPPVVGLRKSITNLSPTEIASLRKGFAQMIAWNSAPRGSANFKRSLVYWANIHSFIGPNDTPPIVCSRKAGLNYPGMSGLSIQTPSTPDENATWCTCQHGTIQFLTWHRMYLYYFEQVLQAASGDPNLRLPFWDYETNGRIPDVYRLASYIDAGGASVANPLYVASRQAQLANGTQALDPAVTSTSNAMSKTSYNPFNSALEQTPHGAVHCATGVASCPSGYMGYVPTAGNDPIFYSHHANIDRLYECWLRVAPSARLPNDPGQLAQQFSFTDGSGALVTRKVGDMLTLAQLNYRYAAGGGCPPVLFKPTGLLQVKPMRAIPLSGPVILNRGATSVPLTLAPAARTALFATKSAQNKSATVPRRATLVLSGLAYDEIPATLYKVYLQGKNGKRTLVGVINFFNATAPHHDMDGMAGHDMAAMVADKPNETSFDVTDALSTIGVAGDASLVIEPSSGVTGSPRRTLRKRSA